MRGRNFLIAYGLVLAAVAGHTAASCTAETVPPVDNGPKDKPAVEFLSPSAVALPDGCTPVGDAPMACAVVAPTDDQYVPVTLSLPGFIARAPGQCGPAAHCGHVKYRVIENGADNKGNDSFAYTTVFDIDLTKTTTVYGQKTVTAQLLDDLGYPWIEPPAGWYEDGGEPEAGYEGSATAKPITGKLDFIVVSSKDQCPQWTCAGGGSSSSTSSSSATASASSATGTGGAGASSSSSSSGSGGAGGMSGSSSSASGSGGASGSSSSSASGAGGASGSSSSSSSSSASASGAASGSGGASASSSSSG